MITSAICLQISLILLRALRNPPAVEHFTQGDGPAVAQLTRPLPKLVPSVALRVGLGAGQGRLPRHDLGELWPFAFRRI